MTADFLNERTEARNAALDAFHARQRTNTPPRPQKRPPTRKQAPPKRLITVAERELDAVRFIAERLHHQWRTYEATCAALNPPTLKAGGNDPGRGSEHPDPVSAIVLAHVGGIDDEENPGRDRIAYDDIRDAVHSLFENARWLEQHITATLRTHGELGREADTNSERDRCDGSWDPTCIRLADKAGKCARCYMAAYRAKQSEQECNQRVTERDSVRGNVAPVSVEPRLPVAGLVTAEVECLPCGQRFAASGFDERVARADAVILRDRHDCPARKAG